MRQPAFEWAASHEPKALHAGVPQEVIKSIKFWEPISEMEAPSGTVVQLIRGVYRASRKARRSMKLLLRCSEFLTNLITLTGTYVSTVVLLTVFEMQLDGDETHLSPSLK